MKPVQSTQSICLYCGNLGLQLEQVSEDMHCLSCDNCGARGPRSPLAQTPKLYSQETPSNLFKTVIDESPDIIILKNWEGDFLLCNKTLAKLYGTTPEAMVGKSDADFNPNQEQVAFYLENIQSVMRSGETQVVYESSTDANTGEERYFQSIKKPLTGPDGSDQILVIAHDITELKRAHQEIEEKERRYEYAMNAADVGIWDWDLKLNQVTHNSKWCELLGLDDQMSVHDMAVLADYIHPDDRESMMAALDKALQGGGVYSHEQRMLVGDGNIIWVYDRGRVVEYDDEGRPARMVGSMSDITMRKRFEQRLEETSRELERTNEQLERLVAERTKELELANQELKLIASKDPLTGVGNRMLLDNWLAEQATGSPVEIVLLDLDHFKQINDRFGHTTGDRALVAVAECLSRYVGGDDLLVRWGGEEFLLILTGSDSEPAATVAEQILCDIQQLDVLPGGEFMSASIGVSSGVVEDVDKAIAVADKALYQAKAEGRNRTVLKLS